MYNRNVNNSVNNSANLEFPTAPQTSNLEFPSSGNFGAYQVHTEVGQSTATYSSQYNQYPNGWPPITNNNAQVGYLGASNMEFPVGNNPYGVTNQGAMPTATYYNPYQTAPTKPSIFENNPYGMNSGQNNPFLNQGIQSYYTYSSNAFPQHFGNHSQYVQQPVAYNPYMTIEAKIEDQELNALQSDFNKLNTELQSYTLELNDINGKIKIIEGTAALAKDADYNEDIATKLSSLFLEKTNVEKLIEECRNLISESESKLLMYQSKI